VCEPREFVIAAPIEPEPALFGDGNRRHGAGAHDLARDHGRIFASR
jgi:hypothetical protein